MLPGLAAVNGFEDAAASSVPRTVLPGAFACFPKRCVSRVRIPGIDQHIRAAGVFVLVQDLLESTAAVSRAKDAALFVRSIRMSGDRDQEMFGIAWVNRDLRNLLTVTQAKVRPGLSTIG